MKRLLALGSLLALPMGLSAQTARVELDHIFIAVPAFGQPEIDALQKLGFTVDTKVARHEAQGTASRSVRFDNAYLELLWVDSSVSVSAQGRQALSELERVASWRSTGASPFGLGLRRLEGPETYGVPTQRYSGAWMEPGSYIEVLKQPHEERAVNVFVVPTYMSVPAWIDEVREHSPMVLQHANGSRSVTALMIAGPPPHHPAVAKALKIDSVSFAAAEEPLMTLELDSGVGGEVYDLRPLLPLVIRR